MRSALWLPSGPHLHPLSPSPLQLLQHPLFLEPVGHLGSCCTPCPGHRYSKYWHDGSLTSFTTLLRGQVFNFIYVFTFDDAGSSLPCASGGGCSLMVGCGPLLWRPLLPWRTGSGARGPVAGARGLQGAGSVVVARGLSCSAARGTFPDQELNPCPLRWQANSTPQSHQGSPKASFYLFSCSRFIFILLILNF